MKTGPLRGDSVTRPAKPANPSMRAGGVKILDISGLREGARHTAAERQVPDGAGTKKAKSEIADQIADTMLNGMAARS